MSVQNVLAPNGAMLSPKEPSRFKKGVARLWLALYGFWRDLVEGPEVKEDEPVREGKQPPEPCNEPSPDKRVDVLLSLYSDARSSIHHWEDRIYQAATLSAGAIISAVLYILQRGELVTDHRGVITTMLTGFGVLSSSYLIMATRAHANNGKNLVKLEAALSLCRVGTYLTGRRFYGYSGRWVRNWRAPILFLSHSVIWFVALLVVWRY